MRARGKGGVVAPQRWEDADLVLPHAHSVVVSEEDVEPFEKDALEWFQRVPVGVVTRGSRGATLFVNGDRYHVEPDHGGRGRLDRRRRCLCDDRSSSSIEREGITGMRRPRRPAGGDVRRGAGRGRHPDRAALDARLRAYRRRQAGG